ncbi:MAG: hypothetical protein K0V04_24385 [Deltaproteobacteria bacterium]|nr:hypothetical protein [Deltaproteobacteria bacterium]
MYGTTDRFTFYLDAQDQWRWTRYAPGTTRIVGASTEGYHDRSNAEANARRLGWECAVHPCSATLDRWTFYRDRSSRWRWRRRARNGRIVGAAHRGFATAENAQDNARRHGWQHDHATPRRARGELWRPCVHG